MENPNIVQEPVPVEEQLKIPTLPEQAEQVSFGDSAIEEITSETENLLEGYTFTNLPNREVDSYDDFYQGA